MMISEPHQDPLGHLLSGFSYRVTHCLYPRIKPNSAGMRGYVKKSHIKFSSQTLAKVWKSGAPSKAIAFSWQLLQDRIPTRQNLFRRHIIRDPSNILCIFCETTVESVDHLFVTCDLSSSSSSVRLQ
ncbi:cysteine-rich receptor-like protein kinase [Trifolium medium]|uniref:Cysteine-rich receptor-like protein kinase n=1 Tax=Trifolium medium TaxID=97028 RepID=A0A392N1J8_9FABA|nr:cysteine-rich receptor-like protein kinase [Trifolium medium]